MAEAEGGSPPAPAARYLFAIAILAGSFLLFLVQPMLGRLALPRLGGAPAVWNSAMLVYQLILLAGYAYAHWLCRLSLRAQAGIHVALFCLAALLLPIGLSNVSPHEQLSAFVWVPWLFLVSIGPLFFVVAANAPLLQRWFASTTRRDPYPLYAASNLGSFAGLLAYPLLFEPILPIAAQRWLWSAGYVVLALLIAGCALVLVRQGRQPAPASADAAIPWRRWLKWAGIAAVPSGLMLSTTLFLTTDLNPMPLLWVVPLGLYLLSFVIAFSAHGRVAELFAFIAPYLLVPASIAMFIGDRLPLEATATTLLITLFVVATALHRRLFEDRPEPASLTSFFLALSVGGALGGLFCALVAPLLFDWTYEYPLLLFAAAIMIAPGFALLPERWFGGRYGAIVILWIAGLLLIAGAVIAILPQNAELQRYGAVAAMMVGTLVAGQRALLLSAMAAAMIMAGGWDKLELSSTRGGLIRTYFGVYSVVDRPTSRQLLHGTTLHGIQLKTDGWETAPTTYYGRDSGVGQALQAVPALFGQSASVSVVGLGAGTLACYRRPGQRWTFYEIDPAIVDLAARSSRFTFIERCAPDARFVVGDARIALASTPRETADVLIVDAFSSDAVPMHLLTHEAFAIYARTLRPNGLLLVHVSNRHLDLERVVAAAPGWHVRVGRYNPPWDHRQLNSSDWMALSHSPETISGLAEASKPGFWDLTDKEPQPWTDERAALLSIFK